MITRHDLNVVVRTLEELRDKADQKANDSTFAVPVRAREKGRAQGLDEAAELVMRVLAMDR